MLLWMTLQGQKWVWGYLSVMMINYFSLIFWPWGSTYGSSLSVNVNLQHKDGLAREPERKNSFKIQTCTYSQSHKREEWDWNRVHMGWGKEEVAKRGKNSYCFIWTRSKLSPRILGGIFFFILSYLCFLGNPMPPDPLCPSQNFVCLHSEVFKNMCRPCLIKKLYYPSLLLGGFTWLS